ncbi:hypothetical protein PXH66_02430 [Synoicihabitans lomoniglobus]|uniref:HAMP domain-containing protein n=1 Tax=Synoicihabitans lomoniglobus TaxID=2909285 RepID=A0AAF0CIR6_9BACT|nr:hypothetical protein PXH66_02430 [Opitutaceae bacterium LMO-M01]
MPLFLVVGIAGSGVSWLLESRELRHGAEAQARTMAVSLAEYLYGQSWPTQSAAAQERLERAEVRFEYWKFVRAIQLWDQSGRRVHRWVSPAAGEVEDARWMQAEVATGTEESAVGELIRKSADSAVARGGALVWSADGQLQGWVECELDANDWLTESRHQEVGNLRRVVGIVILGVILAWLVSRLLAGDVRRLISSARAVGEGKYVAPDDLRVREFAELSESFGVLDGLTHEYRLKFRRAMIENEVFRTSGVLAQAFRAEVMPSIDQHIAGRRVMSRLFDASECSRWHGAGGDDQTGWLWFGRVEGLVGSEVARLAFTVKSELETLLIRQKVDPVEALQELAGYYQITRAIVVTWTSASTDLEIFDYNRETDVVARRRLTSPVRFVGHDLVADEGATIDVVVASAADAGVEQIYDHIVRFLGDTDAVVTIVE